MSTRSEASDPGAGSVFDSRYEPWLPAARPTSGLSPSGERRVLAALLVFAGALRWLRWQNTTLMFNDGPDFLVVSERMARGEWLEAIGHPYHPLYSLLTWLAHFVIPSWPDAAVAVSVLGGTLSVLFLFLLLRDTFGFPYALAGALLLAVHSRAVDYSSDVQSDGVFLAAWLAAVAFGWRAWRRASPGYAAASGAAAGSAYLARPEGLTAIVALGLLGAWEVLRRRWSPLRGLGWAAALVGTALLVMSPYLGALRAYRGEWTLTQKKSVAALLGVGPPQQAPPLAYAGVPWQTCKLAARPETLLQEKVKRLEAAHAPRAKVEAARARLRQERRRARQESARFTRGESTWIGAFAMLHDKFRSVVRPEMLVPFYVGLLAVLGRPGRRGAYLGVFALVYFGVLMGLAYNSGYASRRHLLPLGTLGFGYAALGLPVVGAAILLVLRGVGRRAFTPPRLLSLVVALGIVGGVALGRQVEMKRDDRLAERRAADWLRDQDREPGVLAVGRQRVAYHVGEPRWVGIRPEDIGDPVRFMTACRVRYMIVDEAGVPPDERFSRYPGMRQVHLEQSEDQEVSVYVFDGPAGEAEGP